MTFTVLEMAQRSPEWVAARLGRLTGSRADAMLAKGRKPGEESVGRRNLRVQLTLERLTGRSLERDFTTPDMQHGIDTEAEAFGAYEALSCRLLQRVGFCQHNTLMAGCSPDGVAGDFEGLISIKCPKSATHLETLRSRTIPTDYLRQIMHELWITKARWADYFSYDGRFPEPLRAVLIRVDARAVDLDGYETAALAFLKEVDAEYAELEAMMHKAVA